MTSTTTDELIKLSHDWMQVWKDNDMNFLKNIPAPGFRM